MNRKQTITLWIVVVSLSLISIVHGLDEQNGFYTFVVPILLVGGMLLYQLRDKPASDKLVEGARATRLLFMLIIVNLALITFLLRQGIDVASTVAAIEDRTYSIDSQASSLEANLADVASALEDVKMEVSVLAFSR